MRSCVKELIDKETLLYICNAFFVVEKSYGPNDTTEIGNAEKEIWRVSDNMAIK